MLALDFSDAPQCLCRGFDLSVGASFVRACVCLHSRQLLAHKDPISSMYSADHLGCSHGCLAEGNVLSMGVHLRQESCMTQPFALLRPVETITPPLLPYHC